MRTAILYAGQLRSWSATRVNHEKNLVGDRYFYTTERPDGRYKQFVQDYTKTYYPDILHDYDSNRNPITQQHGSQNQWHSMFVGFCLVSTDYEVYVKCRPDIEVSAKINFEDYDYPDNRVYVPEGNDHCGGVNDQIAFGNYMSMKKYFSIYTEHHKLFAKGIQFHTEAYVTENLRQQGVEIVRIPQTTQIIREWQAVKRGNVIASEYPHEHWKMLQVKGKKVIDMGCGKLWEGFPNTIEYFLNEGAAAVVGVEMSDSEEKWYDEHVPEAKIFTDCINSTEKMRHYLTMGCQVVKMDIEGAESLLEWMTEQDMGWVEQLAIEYHSADKRRIIEEGQSRWGFSHIEHYVLHDFPEQEQGVIYLRR